MILHERTRAVLSYFKDNTDYYLMLLCIAVAGLLAFMSY